MYLCQGVSLTTLHPAKPAASITLENCVGLSCLLVFPSLLKQFQMLIFIWRLKPRQQKFLCDQKRGTATLLQFWQLFATWKHAKKVKSVIIQSNISASDAWKGSFSSKENVFLFLKTLIKMFTQHTQSCVEERHIFCRREKEYERGYYSGKFMLLHWRL